MAASSSLSAEATTGDVQEIRRKKDKLQLNPAHMSDLLKTQLCDMQKFFREPISTIRTGQCLAEATIDTTVRRVMSKHDISSTHGYFTAYDMLAFLGFRQNKSSVTNPDLTEMNDLESIQEFLAYMEVILVCNIQFDENSP